MLRSSPYSTPLPAFSDTRPTYSRDAQDDEASSYEDPSGANYSADMQAAKMFCMRMTTSLLHRSAAAGNSFVLQLRTPSRMAAGKLAGTGTSQLANATGKHRLKYSIRCCYVTVKSGVILPDMSIVFTTAQVHPLPKRQNTRLQHRKSRGLQ